MPKLVVTDLDRTLWGLDCIAPAAHLEALAELEAAGHVVLAATGRRLRNIARLFDLNGLQLPAVALDGSIGMDFAAIGDGVNDLELLEAASSSIAIAGSHASQAANPNHTIPPPEQSGWAAVPSLVD